MPTLANGQIIMNPPKMIEPPPPANINGSMLNVAAAKTLEDQRMAAQAFSKMGAGQKGGGKYAYVPELPEGGTIKGVSYEKNFVGAIDNLNQLRANAAYDGLSKATPIQIAGKRRLRTKKKHGSRRNRTHRRKHRRGSRRRRRSRRSVV